MNRNLKKLVWIGAATLVFSAAGTIGFRNWKAYTLLGVADTHQLQKEYQAYRNDLEQKGQTRPTISQQDLLSRIQADQAPIIIDVRTPKEYEAGHIPGAINIDYRELPKRLNEISGDRDQLIVTYCRTGIRAGVAEKVLRDAGFSFVQNQGVCVGSTLGEVIQ